MPLRKVRYKNWLTGPSDRPLEHGLVNTDHIVSVTVGRERGSGPCVSVKLVDGTALLCQGTPDDFLGAEVPEAAEAG